VSRRTARNQEDGSISIEYVMFTPIIFLVLALVYGFARVAGAEGNLDSATRDAVRVASQAPNPQQATKAAQDVLDKQFAGYTCVNSKDAQRGPVMTLTGDFVPGSTLTIATTCQYDVSDLGLPGLPGTLTTRSQFSSMIDPNRTLG
jgi:Flp pilus assembly protein TadG